ncbi:MAG TPA: FAD-binding and (Fe-S)-binding domain-containing protein [Polyangiaceae bacterium]|nr:FAD-binding and (Fe-S)-binding domain-containing protein [Polyangiaceae bacterium]
MQAAVPRLDPHSSIDPNVASLAAALQQGGFTGEIRTDHATRLSAATDNSIYQMLPAAVIFPRTTADVALALRLIDEPRFHGVALTARGGGTGTNGQALTTGVVMDLSRHMAKILMLDLAAAFVTVQPGVVLDDLNAFLKPHGVYFAANLSPSNRATLGGMVATDASGEGSRRHGKTSQHVLDLEVVLRGGIVHRTARVAGAALDALCEQPGLVGQAHKVAREIATTRREDIARTFPKLRRYMTGYNLVHMAASDGSAVDLAQLVAGSEGSLGVVTEAKLRLTHFERHRALLVLRYPSFDAALASADWLVATDPGSVETLDETVLGLARNDVIYDQVRDFLVDTGSETTRAINLVEYSGDDEAGVKRKVDELLAEIASRKGTPGVPHGHAITWKPGERESLWNLRKKGVGLLGNAPGARKPVPFVEDTVVPPENLQAYVREFRALLDAEGLRYGMFGHVDVGCLHVRPWLDMKDPADEARVRRITDGVTALVTRYGGLLWGEHGKGFRSELVPHHFGPVLYPELQRIKAVFDPRNQLNPGKIATPAGGRHLLARVDGPTRGALDRQIAIADREALGTVIHCNGNGQCFDTSTDNVMCPSSKITRDRIHSPKGRATMMREWLRLMAEKGVVATQLLRARGGLPWLGRLWQRSFHSDRSQDFSHQVYDAMSGCLACKACATQCPVRVDVPDFRAQFLELYHRRYARPIGDYFTALLERMLPLMASAPRLANALMGGALGRWVTTRLIGIADAPLLDPEPAVRRLARHGIPISTLSDLERLPKDAKVVVVLQDAFTTFYEPGVLEASCLLLRALGFQPHVLPYFENGKALHIKGFLREFGRVVARNTALLRKVGALGFPLVGIEPAVVLTYRDEYPKQLESEAGFHVALLQEWLAEQPLAVKAAAGTPGFRLLSHCTEQALVTRAPALWAKVFGALGVPLEIVKSGCCGMCGVYGHEVAHKPDSLGIFELSWRRKIDPERDRVRTLATGHSCRTQVERTLGFSPRHPAQALLGVLESSAETQPRGDGSPWNTGR